MALSRAGHVAKSVYTVPHKFSFKRVALEAHVRIWNKKALLHKGSSFEVQNISKGIIFFSTLQFNPDSFTIKTFSQAHHHAVDARSRHKCLLSVNNQPQHL